jgi:hypothetical protein
VHEHLVEQARLLLHLVSTLRAQRGSTIATSKVLNVTNALVVGIDRLHEDLVDHLPHDGEIDATPARTESTAERYAAIIAHLREQVARHVPVGGRVAVVSRGDPNLVDFAAAEGWHFPQNELGTWAGYHPVDGRSALRHLDELRARGVRYFAVPATSGWWLEWYRELHVFLTEACTAVACDDRVSLFALPPPPPFVGHVPLDRRAELSLARLASAMVPPGAAVLEITVDEESGPLVARVHDSWLTQEASHEVLDDIDVADWLRRPGKAQPRYLVAHPNARDRLPQPGGLPRTRCLFDRAALGVILQLSEQIPEDEGAWAR